MLRVAEKENRMQSAYIFQPHNSLMKIPGIQHNDLIFLNFSKCHFFPKDGLFLLGFSLPNYSCLDYLTTPDISSLHALIMFGMLEEPRQLISTK